MATSVETLSAAEKLLWNYGVSEPSHIDLDAIAFDLNAQVRYRRLDGCEARLVADGERALISINSRSSDGRQRFSLGHELAHWLSSRTSFRCLSDDIGPQNAEAKNVEAQANSFASQLLLPDYLVQPLVLGKTVSLDTAAALAKEFRTSLTPAAIKLVKRTSTPACVACHGQTRLHWFQKNRTFPADLFVTRELHSDTDAFSMVFGAVSGMSRARVEPAARWLTGSNVFRMSIQTQSVKLPDGTALTVLALIS